MNAAALAVVAALALAVSAAPLGAASPGTGPEAAEAAKKKCKKKRKCRKRQNRNTISVKLRLDAYQFGQGIPPWDEFLGEVAGPRECQIRRQVTLRVERGAVDPVVATETTAHQATSAAMKFTLAAQPGAVAPGERVYAVVAQRRGDGFICAAETSNLFTKPLSGG